MTVALIDGDEAILKACVIGVEDPFADEGEESRLPPTLDDAKRTLRRMVEGWAEKVRADDLILCLSPDDRKLYRRGIYPAYKGGRGEKPAHFWELVAWAKARWEFEIIPGLEADDVMGLLSGEDRVIVSSDKDMKTVPGRLYNPKTDTTSLITPARADWQWMHQTLTGDTTDGYAGCIGIGPKTATEILDCATSIAGWWPAVVQTFETPKRGKYRDIRQTRKDAFIQAALARILRPGDYQDGVIRFRAGATEFNFNVSDLIRD